MLSNDTFDPKRVESKLEEFQRKGEDISEDFDREAKRTALETVREEKKNLVDQIVDLKLKYEAEEMEKIISSDLDVEIYKSFRDTIDKWKLFFRKFNSPSFNKIVLNLESKIKNSIDTQWTNLLSKRNEIDLSIDSCEEGKELLQMKEKLDLITSKVNSFRPFKEDKHNSFACPFRIVAESLKETTTKLQNKIDEYIL